LEDADVTPDVSDRSAVRERHGLANGSKPGRALVEQREDGVDAVDDLEIEHAQNRSDAAFVDSLELIAN